MSNKKKSKKKTVQNKTVAKIQSSIISAIERFRKSEYYNDEVLPTLEHLLEIFESDGSNRRVKNLVCYGLGSLEDALNVGPRHQFALLLIIFDYFKERFKTFDNVIDMYDPSFTDIDLEFLSKYKEPIFNTNIHNEFCARNVELKSDQESDCSLFFMPFCDTYLYNNLLGANWSANRLKRLILFGNNLTAGNIETTLDFDSSHYLKLILNNFSDSLQVDANSKINRGSKRKKRKSTNKQEHSNEKLDCCNRETRILNALSLNPKDYERDLCFHDQAIHFFDWKHVEKNLDYIKRKEIPNWLPIQGSDLSDVDESKPVEEMS